VVTARLACHTRLRRRLRRHAGSARLAPAGAAQESDGADPNRNAGTTRHAGPVRIAAVNRKFRQESKGQLRLPFCLSAELLALRQVFFLQNVARSMT
jgi:hypothetical protein